MVRRGWMAAAWLVAGGLLLATLGVEISLRLAFTRDTFDSRYPSAMPQLIHVASHPFLPFVGAPQVTYRRYMDEIDGFVEITNNAYGFRTDEFPSAKSERDLVIVCLGESTTWDYIATSNAKTWPSRLEHMLAARYPERNVRVVNLGIEGGSTAYSVVALGLIGIHLQPDLVIVYHGFNDYGAATAQSYRWDYSHHYVDVNPQALWYGFARNLPEWMKHSYAVTCGAALLDQVWGVNDLFSGQKDLGASESDPARAVQRILPNLESMASIAAGHGARILFSTFQYRDSTCIQNRLVNPMLRQYFSERGHTFVDQDALLPDDDPTLQVDACHFTAKGSELLARNFYDAIVAQDLLGAPESRGAQ